MSGKVPREQGLVRKKQAIFAVPGNIDALTGGYIYEKHVLLGLQRSGWQVTRLDLPDEFPTPSSAAVETVARAFETLPDDRPVLLDGFLPGAMPPEAFARLRAPFVAITHHPLGLETGLDAERATYLHQVERANLARAQHIIVPSPHTADVLASDFGIQPSRITVARPGVSRSGLLKSRRVSPPLILCVGQLVPRKGQDVLLNALSRLTHIDWQARIVGRAVDDAYTTQLYSQAERLGLADRVAFTGEIASEDLAQHYGEATVFALPTRYEGYGMVFAEALLYGLPIVSCTSGAVPQTVPEDAGLLVSPDDAMAFSSALETVLVDAATRNRLSAAASGHGSRLPTWEETAAHVADALERAYP